MNFELGVVLTLLAIAIMAFILNRPRMDMVALIAIVVLPLTGIISLEEALRGFSDSSVILIVAFFAIGEGLVRTGVAYSVGNSLVKYANNSPTRLLILLMLAVALLGSIMSSTAIVAIFIPIVLSVARKMEIHPKRLLMPLSFAGLISGMLTLVATPPNLVVSSQLELAGEKPFAFLSFTPIGLIVLFLGILYMVGLQKLQSPISPEEKTIPQGRKKLYDYIQDYQLMERSKRLLVKPHSDLIGSTIGQLALRENYHANLLTIERQRNRFASETLDVVTDRIIEEGDILLVDFFYRDYIQDFCDQFNLRVLPLKNEHLTNPSHYVGLAEVMIPPRTRLVNKSIMEAEFRSHYHLNVVGVRRHQEALKSDFHSTKLKAADTLLVIGPWKAIRKLQSVRDFVVLSLPLEESEVAITPSKAPFALFSLFLTVALMISGLFPNVLVALFGALLMGAFGCLTPDSAYRSIHWQSIILIVGMFPFAIALEKTGGLNLMAHSLLGVAGKMTGQNGESNIHFLLLMLFLLTALTGLFISNTATAILLAPLAIEIAHQLGVSPFPFAMVVAIAASAAFMTPISSPVNTLVVEPGQYKFMDFVKVGVPFTLIVMIVAVFTVPILFPL